MSFSLEASASQLYEPCDNYTGTSIRCIMHYVLKALVAKKQFLISSKAQAGIQPQSLNRMGKTNACRPAWDEIQLLIVY